MANYIATGRTNYFRVTDDDRCAELIANLGGECHWDYSETQKDGSILHCFAVEGGLDWYDHSEDDPESDLDYFIDEMQKILADDDAIIYTESGHEKHRYVNAFSMIITKNSVDWIDLPNDALAIAQKHLGKDYRTQMTY